MKNKQTKWLTAALSVMIVLSVNARENVGGGNRNSNTNNNVAAGCNPGQAQTELAVNNIRTTILTGGDMWWDLNTARYEIPKGSGAHSMFAGSLWIGGVDASGTLKVAAMTYRQTGNDFWPGPLDTVAVSIDQPVCNQYDKHFRIKFSDVQAFYDNCLNPQTGYVIPQSILNWPGNGDPSKKQGHYLAPFFDANGDGIYNPYDCDFPDYNVNNRPCSRLYGDETLWWVFNDKGNIHTETGSDPIGLEIRAQAFGFNTNDEINNMSFYSYEIINRSYVQLNNCYFGQWCDPDLGLYSDDYVGCDVPRGLGFIYNGDADDGGGAPGTYGLNPPALGCDFFQGPLAPLNDGVDNNRNCVIDEPGEQLIMSKFVYYNNDNTVRGNPSGGLDIYNYLRGIWRDGTSITYGGSGYNTGVPCNFMFPESSDHQYEFGTGGTCANPGGAQADWDEVTALNQPADRRFLQTAGPFSLAPGAVNNITVGLVWARGSSGGNRSAIGLIKIADDKAQKLFDNCFKVLNGPDAPDITLQELDKQLILYLSNSTASNNYMENYSEYDPLIIDTVTPNRFDTTYNFQGYQIFQLKSATVSQADLHDASKARLVYQCDIKDGVTRLINYNFDANLNANVPVEEVNGEDKGISHSISITQDAFATGDPTLVNHKTYYYMAITYGYNQYAEYKQDIAPDPSNIFAPSYNGQKLPYKAGRRNVKVYSGIPHIPSPEANGTSQNSYYGMGPKITRIEGRGNGGNVLDITDAVRDQIFNNNTVKILEYDYNHGPVTVKVIDPLNVPEGTFTLKFTGVLSTSNWTLKNNTTGQVISSERTIAVSNEQLIPEWGMSVTIEQVPDPGTAVTTDETNGFLSASMTFADPTKRWLTALPDADGFSYSNWIRSGTASSTAACVNAYNDESNIDPNQKFEQVLGGTWAPYRLCASQDLNTPTSCYLGGPAFHLLKSLSQMKNLASIDIVITSDKSKWTRCPVIELAENPSGPTTPHPLAEPQGSFTVRKLDMRGGKSVDKNGNVGDGIVTNDPNDADYIAATGMGWFPGYVVNLETGERLNMAFGENSALVSENGKDMKWNPTSKTYGNNGNDVVFGGQHYIYIFGHNATDTNSCPAYDAGAYLARKFKKTSNTTPGDNGAKRNIFKDAMWVNIPLLSTGRTLLETDVTIKLRVKKSYQRFHYVVNDPDSANPSQNLNKPMYTFNTADIRVLKSDNVSAKNALDLINVVPNPYYAYSEYETNQLDNRIKITNLPEKCTVKIFTVNGTLVKTFKKDDPKTSLDWNLKNTAGIPVASGMYIIHVDVEGVGEKVLKWFGVMRPLDLDQF